MGKRDVPLDEFTKLLENPSHDLSVEVYDKIRKRRSNPVKTSKPKYTLNQLGETVDKLVVTVSQLAETVDKGFKQVNARIDRIDTRLDYIVKANNLKDLPQSKQ